MPWAALNSRHLNMAQRDKALEKKRCSLATEEARTSTEIAFRAYGRPITNVTALKYLGHILTATDDNWTVVVANLRKAK